MNLLSHLHWKRARAMPLGGFDDPDAWDLFAEQEQEQVQSEDPIAESPSPAPPDAPAAQGVVGASNESLSPVTSVTSPWAQAEAAMVQQPTVAVAIFFTASARPGEPPRKRLRGKQAPPGCSPAGDVSAKVAVVHQESPNGGDKRPYKSGLWNDV